MKTKILTEKQTEFLKKLSALFDEYETSTGNKEILYGEVSFKEDDVRFERIPFLWDGETFEQFS